MNTYYNVDETMLSEIYGGNSGGAAVVAALGCAAGGVKYGKFLGPWFGKIRKLVRKKQMRLK